MEAKYESLSTVEFHKRYPDVESCLRRLADFKWRHGYRCKRCNHNRFCGAKGSSLSRKYSRQCTRCKYIESATANTLFHKVKFPLNKAFEIVYLVTNDKKGCASTELARKLQVGQKTCWLFKRKVMKAMSSSGRSQIQGSVEVGVFELGHRTVEVEVEAGDRPAKKSFRRSERKRSTTRRRVTKRVKKLAVLAVERRGKGASRVYGEVITASSKAELDRFMSRAIDPTAEVRCNGWPAFQSLQYKFQNITCLPQKGSGHGRPAVLNRYRRLKNWLRGTHGHGERLQGYLDEYCYRDNRNAVGGELFEHLIDRMVERPPCAYKKLYSLNT